MAARSSGREWRSAPRGDLPTAVRKQSTITASRIGAPLDSRTSRFTAETQRKPNRGTASRTLRALQSSDSLHASLQASHAHLKGVLCAYLCALCVSAVKGHPQFLSALPFFNMNCMRSSVFGLPQRLRNASRSRSSRYCSETYCVPESRRSEEHTSELQS